ncbi:FliM/FliN family flagellar motor switch protein [Tianweitania sediminis]|uniref:Flagellar motor switch protein FliM n=2 Tax=Tianweitania sediminis TaxID=1502156 RepID=A0A8J7ULR3_9HYPH|nr:FliM/FliN family flagellar motor switch protein [Tianweitania sediminis]
MMQKGIIEQLTGETGEPDRVAQAGRALAERALPALRESLNAELASAVDVEIDDVTVGRFAQARPSEGTFGTMAVAASETSPDALVLVSDAAAAALLVTALFGAEPDQPITPIDREPTATELDVIALTFEVFARVINGSGERSMTIKLPIPEPLAGKELAKRSLRDGPAVTLRFRLLLPGGSGTISLTMPQRVLLKHRALPEGEANAADPRWGAHFGEEIMRSTVDLRATLAMERMTLGEIADLEVGQVLALPEGAQASTQLSSRGRTLFVCEFGKLGQNYTVRVSEEFDARKDFIDGLLPG